MCLACNRLHNLFMVLPLRAPVKIPMSHVSACTRGFVHLHAIGAHRTCSVTRCGSEEGVNHVNLARKAETVLQSFVDDGKFRLYTENANGYIREGNHYGEQRHSHRA